MINYKIISLKSPENLIEQIKGELINKRSQFEEVLRIIESQISSDLKEDDPFYLNYTWVLFVLRYRIETDVKKRREILDEQKKIIANENNEKNRRKDKKTLKLQQKYISKIREVETKTSKYRGVSINKHKPRRHKPRKHKPRKHKPRKHKPRKHNPNTWRVQMWCPDSQTTIHIGMFSSEIEAAEAYDKACEERGLPRVNFPKESEQQFKNSSNGSAPNGLTENNSLEQKGCKRKRTDLGSEKKPQLPEKKCLDQNKYESKTKQPRVTEKELAEQFEGFFGQLSFF